MIRLTLKRLLALATFRAFRPELADYRHQLSKRLRGSTIALLNIGPGGTKVSSAKFNKSLNSFDILESKYYPVSTIDESIIKDIYNRTDCASVALCINSTTGLCDFHKVIRLRDEAIPEKLIKDPRSIYGEHYELERLYTMLQHPEREIALSFSFSREEFVKVEDILVKNGLNILRVQSGSFNLLNYILAQPLFTQNPTCLRVPLVLDQTFATTLFVDDSWGPGELVFHRSIIPSVLNRSNANEDYEQKEKVITYFMEFADGLRRKFNKSQDFPIEFVVINSKTPQDSLGLISQFMEMETSLKFTPLESLLPDLPKDPEFAVLLFDV